MSIDATFPPANTEQKSLFFKLKKAFILALILLAIGVNVLSPVFAWQWIQTPFLGVLFEHTLVVADTYGDGWAGRLAGLHNPDILLAVNDTSVSNDQELANMLNAFSPGDEVTLLVEHADASTDKIPIVLSRFVWLDYLLIFGVPYIVGLLYLVLGLFVYRVRSAERVGEVFAVFSLLFSILAGAFFDIFTTHYLTTLWTAAIPLTAAALMHLALIFPIETKLIKKRPWLRFAPYAPAVLLSLNGVYWLYNQSSRTGYFVPWRLEFAFMGLSFVIFFLLLLTTWYLNFSPLVRQQVQIIFGGSLLAFTPLLAWIISNALNIHVPLFGFIFIVCIGSLIFFPIAITYAILRYQLLNLDEFFGQILLYAALISVAIIGFVTWTGILSLVFGIQSPILNPIALLVYGLTLVVFLGPIRDGLQRLINRLLFASAQNYRQILDNYPTELAAVPLDVDDMLNFYLDKVKEGVQSNRLFIFFIETGVAAYNIRAGSNYQPKNEIEITYLEEDSLPEWLRSRREILRLNSEGRPVTRVSVDQEELARLAMLDVRVIVPLYGTDRLLGWLVLADKTSGVPYNQADLDFLNSLSNQTAIVLENAQLLEMTNRKTKELLALQETNLDIASEQNTERILTSVVQRATDLLKARGGSIYRLDENYGLLNNEACYNLDQDYASISLKIGQGIAGQVAKRGQALRISRYQAVFEQVQIHPGEGFGPVIAVPFTWQGQVRGVLELIRDAHAPQFTIEDLELLSVLANQAVIALENTRLIREAELRASQLSTLNEVNRVISATLERAAALKLIMEKAVEILKTEAGSIFLIDDTGKFLIFEVALGPAGVELVGAKMPINRHSIAGTIADTRAALMVNDVAADPRWNTRFDDATEFKTRDILGVPMVAFEQVIGVIEVINKKDQRKFTEDDERTLSIFAGQAAIAIVNAQRFTRTDQALTDRVRELTTLEFIDRELNATLDLENVLALTLSSTMDFLGASVGLMAMLDEEKRGLHFEVMSGVAQKYRQYREILWPLEQGNIGKTASTAQPLLATGEDVDNFAGDARSTSQLCIPVASKDSVVGVISLELAEPDVFTQEDLEFATRLVSHAVLAIKNARFFEEVKAANQAKTEFMSVASHELKIPMTSIKGYAKMMSMVGGDRLSEQQKGFLDIIAANVDRMNRLVGDLLDVSRIEAGRIKLEMTSVDIKDVVDEVLLSVRTQIEEKGLELVTDIPSDAPSVWADYGRLVQIVTNLVSNAYKYTPKGGRIEVKAKYANGGSSDPHLSVSVSDTGFGISEEDQQQLFTKFFRASDQNIREVHGTGLGLSITKGMIEMHGGKMWFNSALGQGSTFGFDLPVEQTQ